METRANTEDREQVDSASCAVHSWMKHPKFGLHRSPTLHIVGFIQVESSTTKRRVDYRKLSQTAQRAIDDTILLLFLAANERRNIDERLFDSELIEKDGVVRELKDPIHTDEVFERSGDGQSARASQEMVRTFWKGLYGSQCAFS